MNYDLYSLDYCLVD